MSMLATWWSELRESMRESRGLTFALWWNIVLLVFCVVALPVDHRHILGLNPWIKPIKFQISTIIFLVTIALFLRALGSLGQWRRTRVWLGWGFAACMIIENTIISEQSLRGVRSHMNFATNTDALLFAAMGLFIAMNTALATVLLGLWCVTKKALQPVVNCGVGLGLVLLLIASAEGVRMVSHGAHTVGAPDGGPGLPFLNWSTLHGDMRAAHFFAIHGMEIVPLAALLLARTRWKNSTQIALLCVFTLLYVALVGWLFREAMQGVPLIS